MRWVTSRNKTTKMSSMAAYLNTKLLEAARRADVDKLQNVIRDYRSGPVYRLEFDKALCLAVKTAHSEVVRLLLRVKADISYVDKEGKRALHCAAEIGSSDIMKQIINAGSPVNVADSTGATALHYAADLGHTDVVLLLLTEGAHVNRARLYNTGETPLHLACKSGRVDIAKLLISRGADINAVTTEQNGSFTSLHLACRGRHYAVAQLLCQLGTNVNKPDARGRTPLFWSAETGALDISQLLLGYGCDPMECDRNGATPLHCMAAINSPGYTQLKITELLIEESDLNQGDYDNATPLHYSALSNNAEAAAMLISAGAYVDAVETVKGMTPLNMAVSHNRMDVAKLLIAMGADVNIPDHSASTPLHSVQSCRGATKAEMTELLVRHGAFINVRTQRGYSVLDRCVFHCVIGDRYNVNSLKTLVVAGAHLRPLFSQGRPQHNSPLCWLTWHGQLKSARFLVNAGWDLKHESWLQLPGKNEAAENFLKWLRDLSREPRTLFSSCRKAVREQLIVAQDNQDITPAIHTLPLPSTMKRTLLLEEEGHLLEEEG